MSHVIRLGQVALMYKIEMCSFHPFKIKDKCFLSLLRSKGIPQMSLLEAHFIGNRSNASLGEKETYSTCLSVHYSANAIFFLKSELAGPC